MSTRVITPPSMDLNRDMSQNCPDGPPPPSVVAIPESGEGLPEGSATSSSLGCPSPACSPNSSSSGSTMFPMTGATEHILSMKIRTVPRCLFGPPDPRTAQFAREKVKEIYEQDKNRYNFDFDAEKPLEGPLKWEAVPVAPPTTTSSNVGSYAPKAYALSRFPFLSGAIDRGNVSPPRTTINNNQLPPARQLYFHPEIDREPLLVVRGIEQDSSFNSRKRSSPTLPSTPTKTRPVESTATKLRSSSTASSTTTSQVTSFFSHHRHHHSLQSSSERVLDPAVMLIPSPEASSCSSEDSAHVEMELGEEEEEDVATSVESSSTEDDMKISNVLSTTSNTNDPSSNSITGALSTSSGTSSRLCTSSSSSRTSSISSSTRRTKSVSSSSPSSPSASPSSPTSSQPQITRYLPVVRKRPACTSTTKAASESAPTSSAAQTETKRAAM